MLGRTGSSCPDVHSANRFGHVGQPAQSELPTHSLVPSDNAVLNLEKESEDLLLSVWSLRSQTCRIDLELQTNSGKRFQVEAPGIRTMIICQGMPRIARDASFTTQSHDSLFPIPVPFLVPRRERKPTPQDRILTKLTLLWRCQTCIILLRLDSFAVRSAEEFGRFQHAAGPRAEPPRKVNGCHRPSPADGC